MEEMDFLEFLIMYNVKHYYTISLYLVYMWCENLVLEIFTFVVG
jgi:hypothetical protein